MYWFYCVCMKSCRLLSDGEIDRLSWKQLQSYWSWLDSVEQAQRQRWLNRKGLLDLILQINLFQEENARKQAERHDIKALQDFLHFS